MNYLGKYEKLFKGKKPNELINLIPEHSNLAHDIFKSRIIKEDYTSYIPNWGKKYSQNYFQSSKTMEATAQMTKSYYNKAYKEATAQTTKSYYNTVNNEATAQTTKSNYNTANNEESIGHKIAKGVTTASYNLAKEVATAAMETVSLPFKMFASLLEYANQNANYNYNYNYNNL